MRATLSPEEIIYELGITDPHEIDIEAIAQYLSATIVYEPLVGCDARLIGNADSAFITVNSNSSVKRKRFSSAHELGHWVYDRGQIVSFCVASDFTSGWSPHNPETRANLFAAELLMPTQMFKERIDGKEITLETVKSMSDLFRTSLVSTAIRLVELGSFPSMIIFSDNYSRKWFRRNAILPSNVWPHSRVDEYSCAGKIVGEAPGTELSGDVSAYMWINHDKADDYIVHEESISIANKSVLTLLWWEDESQILDLLEEEG